jgi:hypothetical protein
MASNKYYGVSEIRALRPPETLMDELLEGFVQHLLKTS